MIIKILHFFIHIVFHIMKRYICESESEFKKIEIEYNNNTNHK